MKKLTMEKAREIVGRGWISDEEVLWLIKRFKIRTLYWTKVRGRKTEWEVYIPPGPSFYRRSLNQAVLMVVRNHLRGRGKS